MRISDWSSGVCSSDLPLPMIHGLGIIVGWGMYLFDAKFSRRMRNNLSSINIAKDEKELRRVTHKCLQETGKGLLETFAIWFRPQRTALRRVKSCQIGRASGRERGCQYGVDIGGRSIIRTTKKKAQRKQT